MSTAALAARWGLTWHTARHVAAVMRAFPQARITSGRRTPAHNARVGGSPRSYHLRGRAVDVVVPRRQVGPLIAFAWAYRVNATCTGPEEVLDEGDHVHLAF